MNPEFFIVLLSNLGRKGAETWHPAPRQVVLKGDEDFSFPSEGRTWAWFHRRHLKALRPKCWVIPTEMVRAPYSEERCETTRAHKLSPHRGVKVLLGFNLQSLLRLRLSLTHAETPAKHQELFFRHWKAVLCVLGEKMTWIILENEPWKMSDMLNVSMQSFEIFCQTGTIS